jgi:hypothetical protein
MFAIKFISQITLAKNSHIFQWSSAPDSRYAGRIVRVHFQSTLDRSCVIFKVEGTLSCKLLLPVLTLKNVF